MFRQLTLFVTEPVRLARDPSGMSGPSPTFPTFRTKKVRELSASTKVLAPAAPVASDRSRLFYGWIMLPVAMFGLIATSPGQTYGVMAFSEPIRIALGISHSQLALAYTLASLLAALPITYVGTLMDRHGLRVMVTIGVALMGTACLVAAAATNWLTLFLGFFLLRFLGPGALSLLCGNTLAFWFHRQLGTVEGIRHLGIACAMAVIPAGNLWLVHAFGWRGAYVILGLTVWAIMLPVVLIWFRNRPEDVGQTLDGLSDAAGDARHELESMQNSFSLGEAVATGMFWMVLAGTCLFGLIQTGLFFSLVSILQDRGLAETAAAGLVSSFALSLAAAHLCGGMLSDRLPGQLLMSCSLLLYAVSLGILWKAESGAILTWSGILMGASQGIYFGAANPSWARNFGRCHLGRIRGLVMTLMVASSSLGPLLVGLCRDVTGEYDLIMAAFMLVPIPFALTILLVRKPRPGCRAEEDDGDRDYRVLNDKPHRTNSAS